MSKPPRKSDVPSMLLDRRTALQLGAGFAALVAGCGSENAGDDPPAALGGDSGRSGDASEGEPPGDAAPDSTDAAADRREAATGGEPVAARDAAGDGEEDGQAPTGEALLAGIDTIVVLMMENRSFDHFLGSLRSDTSFPGAGRVDGLRGTETNPDTKGELVSVFKLSDLMPPDPPHEWEDCHAQWNEGKNDGFVTSHAGPYERDVMGYHNRTQLPFMYWLADNFTVCDRWFASVMGPTWPNRYYLHATSSGGQKKNSPFLVGGPRTIWEELRAQGKTAKNYTAGVVAWLAGAFPGKVIGGLNPIASIDQFFRDAESGTLPDFAVIDPDFTANDDHPSHNIQLGQALVASVYKALSQSPQWERCLFVLTYDEHGGFFDHVAPPTCADELADFRQLGFRVPSIVIGPTIRRGYVHSGPLEHASVAATLATRFGIDSLSERMMAASDLSGCIDPRLLAQPLPPPPSPPAVPVPNREAWLAEPPRSSQPMLDEMIRTGAIPARFVDQRSRAERLRSWMRHADRLGAIRVR